jgi:hypothetical protein
MVRVRATAARSAFTLRGNKTMIRMFTFIAVLSAVPALATAVFAENPVRSFDEAVSEVLKEPTKAGNKVGRKASDAVNKAAGDAEKAARKAVKSQGKKKEKGRDEK